MDAAADVCPRGGTRKNSGWVLSKRMERREKRRKREVGVWDVPFLCHVH